MVQKDNNEGTNGTEQLEERVPEIRALLDAVKGQNGATIEIKIGNMGSGPATEYADLTITFQNTDGEKHEEVYNVKRFLRDRKPKVPFPFLNIGGVGPNEYEFIAKYNEAGCNVPVPCVKKGDFFITKKIIGTGLELKLLENKDDERARINLIKETTRCVNSLHKGGVRIQGDILQNQQMAKKIIKCADLLSASEQYFVSLAAKEEDLVSVKERGEDGQQLIEKVKQKCSENFSIFNEFFGGVLNEHFKRQETQLIHGDMTTYHAMIDTNGEVWLLDLDKPKFSNPVFDLAPLYFSQDTNLPAKAGEHIFRKHLSSIHTPHDRIDEEVKSFYLGGCFSNIGRGSKNRVLRVAYPDEYLMFIGKHPSYAQSVDFYKNCTHELIEHVLNNRKRFRIDRGDYQTMNNFLKLLPQFIPADNSCPASILADYHKRKKTSDGKKESRSKVSTS